jgi:malonyl-CoA O-methyltransferase
MIDALIHTADSDAMSSTPPDPPGAYDLLTTQEGYDRWAAIYDSEDNPLIALEEPQVDRLLGDVGGLSLLDVGCGTGRHSLRFASRGAIVTGVDFSSEMIRRATEKRGADRVRFVQHDLTKALPFERASFDRVTCCLVFDHIADVTSLFREMVRVCRPAGSIVVSIMHPAMMLKGIQARFMDPVTGRETRPASEPNAISDYVMGAMRAGLSITAMSEHAVDEALAARSPRAAKYLNWPMLLMMRLTTDTLAHNPHG